MRIILMSLFIITFISTMSFSMNVDTVKAREYLNDAIILQKKFKPQKALPLLNKSLVIYLNEVEEQSEVISDIYYSLGDCYLDLAEFDKSYDFLKKSLEIRYNILDSTSIKIGDNYTLLGLYYDFHAEYDEALALYEKALNIYKNKLPDDDPRIGVVYNNIGICVYFLGDVQRAYLFFEKTYSITTEQFGFDYYKKSQDLNNIGICYTKLKKYSLANDSFKKAIKTGKSKGIFNSVQGARLLHSTGINYFYLRDYKKAIENLDKALKLRLSEVGALHPEVATSYYSLGLCYFELDEFTKARIFFKKALNINYELFGKNHPETGMCYERLARLAIEEGKLDQSLNNINLALEAFEFETEKFLNNDQLPNIQLIEVLATKANAHSTIYNQNYDIAQLEKANHTYQILFKLMNDFRVSYKEGRSKEVLADTYYHIYDQAIEISYELFELTQDTNYLHQAFSQSESTSSLVLLEALRNSKAKKFAGIPDSLIEKERRLKLDITFFEKQKHDEEEKEEHERDNIEISKINSKIFDLKQDYYDLISLFEAKYPQYFKLKYNLNTSTIADVQNKILDEDQALVEYFIGEKSVFIFVITKKSFDVRKIEKDFPLEEWVSSLRSKITRFQFPFNLPGNYHVELVNTAHQLYLRLIQPIENLLPERLMIIPGDVLAYVPFEAFIKRIKGQAHQYKKHDYILKDYSISYCYSATLLKEMIENSESHAEENLLAVAPIFGNDAKPVTLRSMNLSSLKYNIPEAKKIVKLVGGQSLLGDKATELQFTQEASKYHMIHLATHGKADNEIGEYCHLGFTEIMDTIENEWLFVKDIYNVELNASIVTLSACETGVGEIRKGEGVISLARSFSYAGAGCINTTLWKVSDSKTADLMTFYYEFLKSGSSKDLAMRQAKIKFLDSYENMEVHPFYWSSFIAIGDTKLIDPIYFNHSKFWLWLILGGLILVFFIFSSRSVLKAF